MKFVYRSLFVLACVSLSSSGASAQNLKLSGSTEQVKAAANKTKEQVQRSLKNIARKAKELSGLSTEKQDEELAKLDAQLQYEIRSRLPRGEMNHLKTNDIDRLGPKTHVEAGAKNVIEWSQLTEEQKELERIIGVKNLLRISFLEEAVQKQRPVGRVIFGVKSIVDGKQWLPGEAWGTGFLISDSLLMTNNHVIPTKDFAKRMRIQFNFQHNVDGSEATPDVFELDPEAFFHTSDEDKLDYTVVRVKQRSDPAGVAVPGAPPILVSPGKRWGSLKLDESPVLILPNPGDQPQRLTIIQHPDGRRKEIAIHDNFIKELEEEFVRYTTDTEPGSSGSPVFNIFWQVVALHHSAGNKTVVDGETVYLDNEGVRIDAIIGDLTTAQPSIRAEL